MKLLDKQTIVTLKSGERKKEIEEGVKLARKVDLLRETSAKEEINLSKFRIEALKKVQSDIDVLINEKNVLQSIVATLQLERKALLIPLDKEWDRVKKEKIEIEERERVVEKVNEKLKIKEIELSNKSTRLQIEESRIIDLKTQGILKLNEIERFNQEASQLLINTQVVYNKNLIDCESKQRFLDMKTQELMYREIDLDSKQQNTERENEYIAIEKIQLADQRATLERALKRIS